jgi:hypothetical protein
MRKCYVNIAVDYGAGNCELLRTMAYEAEETRRESVPFRCRCTSDKVIRFTNLNSESVQFWCRLCIIPNVVAYSHQSSVKITQFFTLQEEAV